MPDLFRLLTIVSLLLTLVTCRAHVAPPAPRAPDKSSSPPPAQTPPPSPPAASLPAGRTDLPLIQFTIQVGAFSTTERAARYAQSLQAFGLDAYYFIDMDGLCKVRFENYATKSEARHRATILKDDGVISDFYIVEPGLIHVRKKRTTVVRRNIVQTARRFIGTPYRWGGESVANGFDCSGLTMTVYRLNGLQLPRNSRAQFDAGRAISRADLQLGDLVFFATGRKGRVSHVGIYSGQGRFIHAPGKGKKIRSAMLNNGYFKVRFLGARRYL